MAYYYKLGDIPPKRHTQFRQPDGSLYKEELVSSRGFSGIYSNLYHIYPCPLTRIDLPRRHQFSSYKHSIPIVASSSFSTTKSNRSIAFNFKIRNAFCKTPWH